LGIHSHAEDTDAIVAYPAITFARSDVPATSSLIT
jgi:hypothetical protein